ncbi:MAG: gamma-glutamyltransferase [Proteobacteria bacterium]|nr:gamma-glutamyltransferase [Pseudomonadota bacterium]
MFTFPVEMTKRKPARRWRQSGVVLLLCSSVLVACSPRGPEVGTVGYVKGFLGGAAADEPRAALIARDVLSAGGGAVDAAVALYFTLAVTLPSSASLGGGGACVVFDKKSQTIEALDFLARAPARIGPSVDRPSAVPLNPRGMFALHAKYGRLRWEQLVSPAANLARFGNPLSRALARDLYAAEGPLLADRESRRIFTRPDGSIVREGDVIEQLDLAAVLSLVRRAPGAFYSGPFARKLVKAVKEAGGSLTIEDLRGAIPRWRPTVAVNYGLLTAHFAPTPAGVTAAQIWTALTKVESYRSADNEERPHLFAETAMRAFADRGRWSTDGLDIEVPLDDLVSTAHVEAMMSGYSSDRHRPAASLKPPPQRRRDQGAATSFVVADRKGSAVACAFSMNNLFGTGRIAPGTGIMLAAAPDRLGQGPWAVGPMMVINQNVYEMFLVAAAAGSAAPSAMTQVALLALVGKHPIDEAMGARRVFHRGAPDQVLIEPGKGTKMLTSLRRRGHDVVEVPTLGLVNVFFCPKGLVGDDSVCQVRTDPRGYGLGASE